MGAQKVVRCPIFVIMEEGGVRMYVKGDFRLYVLQNVATASAHAWIALQFVLNFLVQLIYFIPIFVMYIHICSNKYVVYIVAIRYTLKFVDNEEQLFCEGEDGLDAKT